MVLVVGRWCSCKKVKEVPSVWLFGFAIDVQLEERSTAKEVDLWASMVAIGCLDCHVRAHAHTVNRGVLDSLRPG